MTLETRLIAFAQAVALDMKNVLPRVYNMPSADASTAPAWKIVQPNAVNDQSAELLQIFLGTIKTLWSNEGGNLRSEAYSPTQVPLKLFGRRGTTAQQANLLEIYTGGPSSKLISRVLPSGHSAGPGQIRAIQSTPPNTSSAPLAQEWEVDHLWLDTSTEV